MIRPEVRLRPALAGDAEGIAALLQPHAVKGLVLPRSATEIRSFIGNFIVAEARERLVGAVALRDFGDGLEEIRSLVVHPQYEGVGIGSLLIRAAAAFAETRHARRLFALTWRPGMFERLGFRQVDKEMFPQKVWADCARCPKRDSCDEVAVLYCLPETGVLKGEAYLAELSAATSCLPPVPEH